ncbi:uncharacterized protein LOC112505357, partial [Cynara cardunculus var. scolymus]|uniref:uncharacterized protein LOC112505357 n=1 Tax=Cynara cardunculus var. scolymus TaxID=59895 RepID=UPI000D62B362
MNPATFPMAVDAAEITERDKNRSEERKQTEKKKWEGSSESYRGSKTTKFNNRAMKRPIERACPRCQKYHRGERQAEVIKCFNCGEIGHTSNFCRQNIKCFHCNLPDHFKNNCPQLKAPQLTMGSNTSTDHGRPSG